MQNIKRHLVLNDSYFSLKMKLHKTLMVLLIILNVLVEVGSQIEPQISPTSTPPPKVSVEISNNAITGISILSVLSILGVCGLIYLYYKRRKVRGVKQSKQREHSMYSMYSTYSIYSTYSMDGGDSEKSIPTVPPPAITTHSAKNKNPIPNDKKTYANITPIQHSFKNFTIRQNSFSNSLQVIRQFPPVPPVNRDFVAPPPNNMNNFDNNNLPEGENKIAKIGSELKGERSKVSLMCGKSNFGKVGRLSLEHDDNIVCQDVAPIPNNTNNFDNNNLPEGENKIAKIGSELKGERSEISLMCGESNFGKVGRLSLEHDDNIVCQETNCVYDDSDDQGSRCILSSTKEFRQTFSLNETSELIQFKINKEPNDLSHLIPLNDIPLDLPNGIPAELYIDKLTVAGQGTVGLKFRATERFRIILNSNTNQSYGKTNVIALDIGDDAAYFRKRNNDNPNDILAFTSERKALLDKDMEQLYWFSLDKKNRRLRYGKGPMQSLLSFFCYDFPPRSSQEIDEYAWIENLRYVGISKIAPPKSDSKPKVELVSCRLPVTMDLPPVIVKHEDATLEELEKGEATVIENLPEACKELYWNVVGGKISLNNSDFPDFADAIEYSINTPGLTCYERLQEKAGRFGGSDPKKTYLRVTLGEDRGNSPGVPYVMEIWPSGHYSPIHSHSNSFGIIKVLYNEILTRYFTGLNAEDKKWYHERTFKEGQITWISDRLYQTHQLLNRTRKVCVTIQCYQYGSENREHYEYFDYLDNDNQVKHFKPNSDWTFAEFKKLIKKEWDRYKYLSGNSIISKNLLISSNDTDTLNNSLRQVDKRFTY